MAVSEVGSGTAGGGASEQPDMTAMRVRTCLTMTDPTGSNVATTGIAWTFRACAPAFVVGSRVAAD